MNVNIYFRPLIPLLLSLICGILLGIHFTRYAIWLWAGAFACAGFVLFGLHRKEPAAIAPLIFFVLLGWYSIQPWMSPRFPPNHLVHYADTRRWQVTGRVADLTRPAPDRIRLDLQVASLGHDDQIQPVVGKLRVTVTGEVPALGIGDGISFESRIRSITNFKNPGSFDYQRFMAFSGIWTTAYARANTLVVRDRQPLAFFQRILNDARSAMADLIESSGHPRSQDVLKALIIGDRAQIRPEIRQAFNRAGVGHLLAISGLHIGIVASVAFVFFHRLMVWVKPLLWRAWTRKGAALLSLLPVWIYGLIAGPSPSTQRAVMMVTVFLMTFLFEREQDPFNTLALAALVILVAEPVALFSISFQLSFAAVFAIVYGLSRAQRLLPAMPSGDGSQRRLYLARKLIVFVLVSFFAITGSLPLVMQSFNEISLVGLLTNCIVVPLVGLITIPLGLAALFILPLCTPLAGWCLGLGSWVLAYALDIVHFFAKLPFASAKTFTPSNLEIVCFYAAGWALLNIGGSQPNTAGPSQGTGEFPENNSAAGIGAGPRAGGSELGAFFQFLRKPSLNLSLPRQVVKITLAATLIILAADACYWVYQRFWHSELRVTVIDVGNGGASLLEFPRGYTLLIDGGGFADNSVFDVGEKVIAPLLWRKKICTVDTLILTHPNSDHLNGLIYIAEHFHVKNVWTNSEPRDTIGYALFMQVIRNRKIFFPAYPQIPRKQRINGVELNLLHPPADFLERRSSEKWRNLNNNSLVVQVTLGSTSLLFPGDIMAAAEKELVEVLGAKLSSSVLIAPHHGSRTSSSRIFLDAVSPEVVIISSGENHRFQLPNPEVLNRYEQGGYRIYRTNRDGAVCLSTDGQDLVIKPHVVLKPHDIRTLKIDPLSL